MTYRVVGISMTNAKMAEKTIRTEMTRADLMGGQMGRPGIVYGPGDHLPIGDSYPLRSLVDMFMANYPRGRGTAKDERLRVLYAACATIKTPQSRTRNFREKVIALKELSDAQLAFLANMPLDTTSTDIGSVGTAKALIERKLIDGYYVDGRLREVWLTDAGLKIHPMVEQTIGSRRLNLAMTQGRFEGAAPVDYDAAMRAIMGFNRRDPKAFIENAKKVVSLFSR